MFLNKDDRACEGFSLVFLYCWHNPATPGECVNGYVVHLAMEHTNSCHQRPGKLGFCFVLFAQARHRGAFIRVTCIHPLQSIHSLIHWHFFAKSSFFWCYITHSNACNYTPLMTDPFVHSTDIHWIQCSFNQLVCVYVCVCVCVCVCLCVCVCMWVCALTKNK